MTLRTARLFLLFIVLHCFIAIAMPKAAQCEPVQFITEQLPPLAYKQDGKLTGYNVDLIHEIWKHMEQSPSNIKMQPWPRSIRDLNSTKPTCLFPVALTEKRRQTYRCVKSPINFSIAIVAHKKDVHKFKTLEQIKKVRISVAKSASILHSLRELGFTEKNFDYGTGFPCGVKKFYKGRTPLVAGGIYAIKYNYKLIGGNPDDLEVVLPIGDVFNGFIFNDAVPDTYFQKFRNALKIVAKSPISCDIYQQHIQHRQKEQPCPVKK